MSWPRPINAVPAAALEAARPVDADDEPVDLDLGDVPTSVVGDVTRLTWQWWPESVEAQDEQSRAHLSAGCADARNEVPETRWGDRMRSGSWYRARRLGLAPCRSCLVELANARLGALAVERSRR